MVLHTPYQEKEKGDAIVETSFAIEAVTKLASIANKNSDVKVVSGGR